MTSTQKPPRCSRAKARGRARARRLAPLKQVQKLLDLQTGGADESAERATDHSQYQVTVRWARSPAFTGTK